MPHPDEPYYCSEQIPIPVELPDILKNFTKAAIRTQPSDLLTWSAKYFRCLANNQIPPVKERLEIPLATQKTDSGLTIGLIKVLHKQLGPQSVVPLKSIEEKWKALNLPIEKLKIINQLGNFQQEAEWLKFIAISCSTISKDLTETMSKVCEVLTADPPGANSRIKFEVFNDLYSFLTFQVEKSTSSKHVEEVCAYLKSEWANRQDGYVHPRNFYHPECPKLSQMV
ncbi:ropporin-1 [Brachionus plicatilis]|uniref:Ropporin-1 n=1 Tax=Brachionus plicatilis TaxID=10195 RepID=A0A3M7RMJ5_BRAPC|nr:ropporin-1 [Brachionus plicatilis]